MEFARKIVDTLIHLSPESVNDLAGALGPWLYLVLGLIVFAETGLVVTPFLPGDSLLFAVGAVSAAPGSPIGILQTGAILIAAAILGDALNYALGYRIGPKVFSREDSRLLNKKHLLEAQRFYERYGAKTIVLARFVPIVRTFAPFVAGIGRMGYAKFALYNVAGGIAWVSTFLAAGWWFGTRKVVQQQFHLIILAIIVVSVLPPIFEALRIRFQRQAPAAEPAEAETGV